MRLDAARDADERRGAGRRVFTGEERQLAEVRHWVDALVRPCACRDDVISVVTELASNAIRHTGSGRGGTFAVEVTQSRDVIRVAVADAGSAREPRVIEEAEGEHGRGLLLVRNLSWRMGVTGGDSGRVVWAEVARGGPNAVQYARELLARTADLVPSAPREKLMRALGEYRAALHALTVSHYPPQ